MRRWSKEDVEWLKNNYSKLGLKPCAEKLNRSVGVIGAKAIQIGVKRRPHINNRRYIDPETVTKLYKEHKTLQAVADILGTGASQVSYALKKAGVVVRAASQFRDNQEAIVADYLKGDVPTIHIGAKYGLSGDRIREGLRELGIFDETRHGRFTNRKSPYECWVSKYGQEEADKREKELNQRRSKRMSGAGNTMYGKPTPQGAGNGWKGWYRGHYFRSLREVMCMIDMDTKGLKWESAEKKKYTIKYEFMGTSRTYRPDFLVGSELWELKPLKLHKTPNVEAKQEAAIRFCTERGLKYVLKDIDIDSALLKKAYDNGFIRFDRDYEARFLAYVKACPV